MTVHPDMFDKGPEQKPTMHRVYVEFEGGYFITSIDPLFNAGLQKMVEELGQPVKVEFRATDEGWYKEEESPELIPGTKEALNSLTILTTEKSNVI